jgi:hypothetical protein
VDRGRPFDRLRDRTFYIRIGDHPYIKTRWILRGLPGGQAGSALKGDVAYWTNHFLTIVLNVNKSLVS